MVRAAVWKARTRNGFSPFSSRNAASCSRVWRTACLSMWPGTLIPFSGRFQARAPSRYTWNHERLQLHRSGAQSAEMAREEAARLHHEYVGTEHILLGIIREGEGIAAAVLTNLNVDLEEVQRRIEETVKKGKAAAAAGPDLPYTSRAKKVLEFAMAEARELNHRYVGTEHLLLGVLREEKGIGAQVLTDAGVTLQTARSEVLQVLGTKGSEASDTTPLVPPPVPYTPAARGSLQLALQEARDLKAAS